MLLFLFNAGMLQWYVSNLINIFCFHIRIKYGGYSQYALNLNHFTPLQHCYNIVGFHPKENLLFFRNEMTWLDSSYKKRHQNIRISHPTLHWYQEYHQIFILPIFLNHQFIANWDTSDKARKCVDFFFSCDVMTFKDLCWCSLSMVIRSSPNATNLSLKNAFFSWPHYCVAVSEVQTNGKGISLQQIHCHCLSQNSPHQGNEGRYCQVL